MYDNSQKKGSDSLLTRKYANGYTLFLRLLHTDDTEVDALIAHLFGLSEDGLCVGLTQSHSLSHGHSLQFRIGTMQDQSEKRQMAVGLIFERLETLKGEFPITEYSLAKTTLEEVFLSLHSASE